MVASSAAVELRGLSSEAYRSNKYSLHFIVYCGVEFEIYWDTINLKIESHFNCQLGCTAVIGLV